MCSVLNTLSEYAYFYISKGVTSHTFLLVFKVIESLQCILNTYITRKQGSSSVADCPQRLIAGVT